jgi:outer membrane protein assembly factor BamB
VVVVLPIVSGGDEGGASEMVELSGADRVPLRDGQTAEPEQKWSVDADVADGGDFAVGGRAFYSIEGEDGSGSTLVARALSDGKETWSDDLPGSGLLFVQDDQLLVRVSDDDAELRAAELRSYDPGDGALRWAVDVEPDLYEARFFGDRILGAGGESLVAYRPEDGREVWSEDTTAPFAVSGDRVYLADGDEVKAISLSSGDEAWTTEMSGDVSALVLAGDAIVASVDDEVVALDEGSGKERWQEDYDIADGATLHAVSGSVVVVAGYGEAVAVDPGSGKELDDDEFFVDEDDWLSIGYRLPDGRLLLFGYEDMGARVLDAGTGERIGQVDDAREITATMVYAVDDGELSGHGLDDAERRWQVDIDDISSARAGDGLIVVQTEDGYELWT